jgi:hypothetical protein
MNIGYVTTTNDNYLKLAEVLSTGLSAFSKYPLYIHRVKTTIASEAVFSKFEAIKASGFDACVFLDADSIPNHDIDTLMDIALNCKVTHPVLPRLVYDVAINDQVNSILGCPTPSMPYSQAACMLIPKGAEGSIDAIQEDLHKVANALGGPQSIWNLTGSTDEQVINVSLWKQKAVSQLNYCIPRTDGYMLYARGEGHLIYPGCYTSFQVFHNHKNSVMSLSILQDLIAHGKTMETVPAMQLFSSH